MGQAFHRFDKVGQSTSVNQRQIPILSEVQPPTAVEDDLIARCENMMGAVHLCIHLSRLSHERICECLGIDKGHWSRMMQGRAHFPLNKLTALEGLCSNLAPTQYLMSVRKLRMPVEQSYKTARVA